MPRRYVLAIGLLLMGAFPMNTLAATASVQRDSSGDGSLIYQAAAGEANQVDASVLGNRTVTIRDLGAVVIAGSGCVSVDGHTVECDDIDDAFLMLGDLNDTLSWADQKFAALGLLVQVQGGAGADTLGFCARCPGLIYGQGGDDRLSGPTLYGGDGNDVLGGDDLLTTRRLAGGAGDDVLSGSDRFDVLNGGVGNDTITAAGGSDHIIPGVGDDTVDAGAGDHDRINYNLPGPVTVNLRTGVATGAGTDTIISVEDVWGSKRGDLLIGDRNANLLNGREGRDVIRGGAGADRLFGGARNLRGADRLFGGPGDDVLDGANGNDFLAGGLGSDTLLAGRGDDVLRSRDGEHDIVNGQRGHDRARVDRGLDFVRGVEKLL
jgi:Ca2+-binding RTX toxin-like protein